MAGNGEEEDFCALPKFQICHYTTGFGPVLSVSFSALTLSVGQQEGHFACKKLLHLSYRFFFGGNLI